MASRDEVVRFVYETTGSEALAAAAKSMLDAGNAGGEASGEVKRLTEELGKLADQSNAIKSFTESKAGLKETSDQLALAKDGLAALNKEFASSDTSSRAASKAFAVAEKSVADLTAQQKAQELAFAKAQGALQKAGIDTEHLATANQDLRDKAAGVSEKLTQTATAATQSGKSLNDAATSAGKLGDKSRDSGTALGGLGDHLGKIAVAAGAAIAAFEGLRKATDFATESFKTVAGVEQSLSRVQGLAQGAAEDFAKLSERVDEAAAAANVSVEQSAAAAAALASQGQSAKDIYDSLIPTMLLAKDASIDVAQSASIVNDQIRRFGLTAADAGHVVDVLVTASKGASDGLSGMADAMGKLSPLARDIGLNFDQTASVLGLFARNGISATTAGRGLKTVFEDLGDPASKLRQSLFALGDGSKDFNTALKTLATSGARGRQVLDGLGGSAKTVMLFLAQQGPDALAKFSAGIAAADGSAQALAKTLDDNLRGAWTSFTLAVDTIGEKLATPLLAPLRDELTKLAGQLTAFAASPAFEDIKQSLGTMFAEGTKAFDDFIQHLDWQGFVDNARSSIGQAAAEVQKFADSVEVVATGLNKIGSAIGVVFDAVMVVFNLAKVALSGMEGALTDVTLKASQAVDKITGSTSKVTLALEAVRDAAYDAARTGIEDLRSRSDKLVANFDNVVGSSLAAGDAMATVGDRAARAAPDMAKIGAAAALSSQQLADMRAIGPPTLQELADAGNEAAASSTAHAAALDAASTRFAAARAEMDRLAKSGDGNAEAFRKAQVEYQAAGEELERLRGHAESAAAGSDALKAALDKIGGSSEHLAQNAKDAADLLDTTFAAFQSGAVKIDDVRTAFDNYAAAQRASVKNADEWQKAQVEANLKVKESLLGLGTIKPPDTAPVAQAIDKVSTAQRQVIDTSTTASRAIDDMGKQSQASGEAISGFGGIVNAYAGWIAEFGQHSAAAALQYQQLAKDIFDSGTMLSQAAVADGTRLAALAESVGQAATLMQGKIDQQRAAMGRVIDGYTDMSDSALRSLSVQDHGLEGLIAHLQDQAAAARDGKSQFDLLGQADLAPLAAALDAAAQKVQAIKDRAEQTKLALEDMASSLQDQIDQINDKQGAIEDRRFQKQLDDLKAQADAAGLLNDSAYRDAVEKANELHRLKMQQISDQAAAAKKASDDATSAAAASSANAAASSAAPAAASARAPSAARDSESTVNVKIDGSMLGNVNPSDNAAMQRLAQALLPEIMRQIQQAARNSGRGFAG